MSNRCSATEIARLVDYLSQDKRQGPKLAREIRTGAVTVLRSELKRSVDLAVLKLCWRTAEAGGEGQPRLIVQNCLDGLRQWRSEYGEHHVWRIRQRMDELLAGTAPGPLVLGWADADWVLQDGNYTAAALYHTWVARPPQGITVYTLRPIAWVAPLRPPAAAELRA